MKVITQKVNHIDMGEINWKEMDDNFENISDDMDELDKRVLIEEKRQPVQMITYLSEAEGYATVLTAKEHGNLARKFAHGFVQAADNVKENVTVHVLRGNKDLCEPVTIKATEKAGKCQSFAPFKMQVIGKMDEVKLYSSSRRKIVVTLVLSSEGL